MTGTATTAGRLDGLLSRHPLPTWRVAAWPVMGLLAILLGWSGFAMLDEVAIAAGEVVPQGRVKAIQHLEGGIIKQIHVNDGDKVDVGSPLVSLDLATGGVNREELQVRLDAQLLAKSRLQAEATDSPLVFSEELAQKLPQQVLTEREAFDARKAELAATLKVLGEQIRQRELEVRELEAKTRAIERNLALARERFAMSTDLVKQNLTPRMDHKQRETEMKTLEGDLEIVNASVPRARAAVAETRERVAEVQLAFRREAKENLTAAEQNLARLRELLSQATDQRRRAEIRSPIDGIVKGVRFHTIGGVVRPGEAIMEIVPTEESLVIEVRLSPTDRGYVAAGQKAVVKISTYDYALYGGLDGEVIQVAPDSSTAENGVPYFRVIVRTEKTYLGEEAGKLPITPGMQATVDIHTGQKSVLAYLMKPVLKLRHEAFRER